ncbi:MAG: pyridoxamine 5'-phosphate oxidase family protein [Planctomycetota bacterium]
MTEPPKTDALRTPDTLGGVIEAVWTLLGRGAADRRHGFHLPVLATTDEHGRPEARTVVLRGADRRLGEIRCHTDARSPKAAHLESRPVAAWCFYDKGQRVQVRASGPITLLTPGSSNDAAETWDRAGVGSKRCYLAPHAPSRPAAEPSPNLPGFALANRLTPDEVEPGRANFMVLVCRVERLEWLALRHDGHRRAAFTRDATGWTETWIEP